MHKFQAKRIKINAKTCEIRRQLNDSPICDILNFWHTNSKFHFFRKNPKILTFYRAIHQQAANKIAKYCLSFWLCNGKNQIGIGDDVNVKLFFWYFYLNYVEIELF